MKSLHNRVDRRLLKERLDKDQRSRKTISFYKYAPIGNPHIFRDHLFGLLEACETLGRIYVSYEGINAQVSVPEIRFSE